MGGCGVGVVYNLRYNSFSQHFFWQDLSRFGKNSHDNQLQKQVRFVYQLQKMLNHEGHVATLGWHTLVVKSKNNKFTPPGSFHSFTVLPSTIDLWLDFGGCFLNFLCT